MSVVNKMLLDIDRRRAAAGRGPVAAAGLPALPRRRRVAPLLWMFAGGLLALALWQSRSWFGGSSPPEPAAPATVAAPAKTAPPPVVTAAAPAANPPAPAQAMNAAAAEVPSPGPVAAAAPAQDEGRRAAASVEKLRLSTRLSALTLAPAAPAVVQSLAPSIAVRLIAGEETARAARALWNEGQHAAAIETLRAALATAESRRESAATQLLARELARFEVSENHPQAAIDVLKRLESRFLDDAEAWALRGNAQQRLGLHAEAADSYVAALRLKPGESRWMLGAAISLAALGKLDEAHAWVERAAERGPLPPSIASYLRQLGVAVP